MKGVTVKLQGVAVKLQGVAVKLKGVAVKLQGVAEADENTPVTERERERTLINLTHELVNTYIDTHISRM